MHQVSAWRLMTARTLPGSADLRGCLLRQSLPKSGKDSHRVGAKTREHNPTAHDGIGDGAISQHGDADCYDDPELLFVSKLELEVSLYLAAALDFDCNHTDVVEFTEAVLGSWKNHGAEV